MLRRSFLHGAGVAAPALLAAQQQRTSDLRLAKLTPLPKPAIATNHLGFMPKARKCVQSPRSDETRFKLRKWMTSALLSGTALSRLVRNLGDTWDLAGAGLAPVLDEIKWGNRYWRKMQDADGRVLSVRSSGSSPRQLQLTLRLSW